MIPNYRYIVLLLAPMLLAAQEKTDLQQILERLDRLEQENKDLAAEVRSLRAEIAGSRITAKLKESAATLPQTEAGPATPPVDERVTVAEHRIDEQAQEKVQASQRLPITLTGMVLFNGYLNGKANGGDQNPWIAAQTDSTQVGGASLSQSVVGLQFQGPKVIGDGHVNGSMYLDLFGGSTSSLNHLVRLRVATISIDWKNTSIAVGQDKPIIAPREPNSLAQVGVSPLTSAGNLWLWQPQVRIEQRFSLGDQAGLRAQLGVYQTSEPSASDRGAYTNLPTAARPSLEGRFEFWRQFGEGKRIEIAPGFHVSTTHVAGVSIPSRLFSLDWLIEPFPKIQFTGAFFHGENDAGVGGLRQGFTIFDSGRVAGIGATGAWSQLSLLATERLSFNLYGGEENDRASDLRTGDIHRNLIYAGNAIYRIGPNVLLGLEASQVRTDYLWAPGRLNNHYDVALGYLF
ncbi:MAG: hypothetical protein ACRD4P_02935 [Bryobacteraceae bacterium]